MQSFSKNSFLRPPIAIAYAYAYATFSISHTIYVCIPISIAFDISISTPLIYHMTQIGHIKRFAEFYILKLFFELHVLNGSSEVL
jgi:hypothetical protein